MDRYMAIVLTTTIICCGVVGCISKTIDRYEQQEMIYFNGR